MTRLKTRFIFQPPFIIIADNGDPLFLGGQGPKTVGLRSAEEVRLGPNLALFRAQNFGAQRQRGTGWGREADAKECPKSTQMLAAGGSVSLPLFDYAEMSFV